MIHFLSESLYYNIADRKCGELNKSFKEYQLLVCALDESLTALNEGNLEKFDSLVGENACQIRAVRIAQIYARSSIEFEKLHKQIEYAQEKIRELSSPRKIAVLMRSNLSFEAILKEHNLNIELTDDELFAFHSYMLTEMKELQCPDKFSLFEQIKCTPTKIKRFNPDISYSFTDRLASHLRQNLALTSVEFVRQAATELKDPHLIKMVSDKFSMTHNALKCIPMFWTYKTLLISAQKEQIPLIAHVKFIEQYLDGYKVKDEKFLFFKSEENKYIEKIPSESDMEKAACVIQGAAVSDPINWDGSSLKESIIDVILAGAADHRQYPNPDYPLSIEDAEYDSYKGMAERNGFSAENPKTFFIQHVYASQVKRTLTNLN